MGWGGVGWGGVILGKLRPKVCKSFMRSSSSGWGGGILGKLRSMRIFNSGGGGRVVQHRNPNSE